MESADSRGLLRSVARWIEYVKLRLVEILVLRGQDTPVIRATRGAYQYAEMKRCRPEITARTWF